MHPGKDDTLGVFACARQVCEPLHNSEQMHHRHVLAGQFDRQLMLASRVLTFSNARTSKFYTEHFSRTWISGVEPNSHPPTSCSQSAY